LAGPVLIVVAVLVVLHWFAFGQRLTLQNRWDTLGYFYVNYCFLGRSLRHLHVPAWNPYQMAGVPFAADPQAGWMSFPQMVLFTAVPSCATALQLFIVFQPLLGGLGMYWFLREAGLSRIAATTGGLALAMGVAGSNRLIDLWAAGTLAWTPVVLATGARFLKARTWRTRLLWSVPVGLAWGQLAAAHFSLGMILGTIALFLYGGVWLVQGVRDERLRGAEAAAAAGLLVTVMVGLNAAYLLPRLAYLGRTSLSLGYERSYRLTLQLAGRTPRALPIEGLHAAWPLTLSSPPGPYLSFLVLSFAFAAFWTKRFRALAMAFALYGAACYVLTLTRVARAIAPVARKLPFGDFYLHGPDRLLLGTWFAAVLLAALGLEAWISEGALRRRALMVAPGVAVWGVLALALDADARRFAWLMGLTVLILLGLVLARRSVLLSAVPAFVAIELATTGVVGQFATHSPRLGPLGPLNAPRLPATSPLLWEDAIARAIRADPRGRVAWLSPKSQALFAPLRSQPFGLQEAQGYNPAQPLRFFTFVRAVNAVPIRHHHAILVDPPPEALDLLQVGWVVMYRNQPPPVPATRVLREGKLTLYRVSNPPPRASVVSAWSVIANPDRELAAVTRSGFDSSRQVVVEAQPGIPSGEAVSGPAGRASYRALGTQSALVDVDASRPAVVLIRSSWDPNWHATVDGHARPVLRADYLMQAVAVPAGHHRVLLTYDDPWVGRGLLASGFVLLALLGGAAALRRRRDRTAPSA